MEKPELYSKHNELQKNDAEYVIDNYLRLIKWNKNDNEETILDIGCGDGDVLLDILLPKLPRNFHKLIGVDVSEKFVKFATNRSRNPKITFEILNIESKEIPEKFCKKINHVFSFYCLHWILDQRQAMANIFKMLKPGGDMLLAFLQSHPVFDIYEKMSKSPKWSPYMSDVKKYIAPYQYSKDPENEMEKLLKSQGFTSLACRVVRRTFSYSSWAKLAKSLEVVNPFIPRLPKNEVENYINDYITEVKHQKVVEMRTENNNKNDERLYFSYNLFVVFATKPLNN